jgi:hypothetical protein
MCPVVGLRDVLLLIQLDWQLQHTELEVQSVFMHQQGIIKSTQRERRTLGG